MERRRVVVTGMGIVSPFGCTVSQTWDCLLKGQSGIRMITSFDTTGYSCQFAATVPDFQPDPWISSKDTKKMDTFIQYGVFAALQAFQDSGLERPDQHAHRYGVALGSGIGGIGLIEKNHAAYTEGGPRKISPFFIPGTIINMAAGHVSIMLGLKGPNLANVTACTTGTHNIGLALRLIQYGDADVMLAGGTEHASTPLGVGGFASMRALSTRNSEPEKASRPWDKGRDGFVLGDGAGVLVLESEEHARKRGAKIYAELAGFGMGADAYHMTAPSGEGAASAMRMALEDARLTSETLDYINAHATSTPLGDKSENDAIKSVCGERAYDIAVSSTKSMTGHLLGAAGAVEAIFSILAIRDQVAPPTINLDEPDEGCDLNYVPHQPQSRSIRVVMSNSFGFGGTNGALVFKKWP